MGKLLFLALLATASPANASISDGIWEDGHGIRLIFNGLAFQKWKGQAPDFWIDCEIYEWPINTPVAKAVCLDGIHHRVEINLDSMLFDGTALKQQFEHPSDGSDGH